MVREQAGERQKSQVGAVWQGEQGKAAKAGFLAGAVHCSRSTARRGHGPRRPGRRSLLTSRGTTSRPCRRRLASHLRPCPAACPQAARRPPAGVMRHDRTGVINQNNRRGMRRQPAQLSLAGAAAGAASSTSPPQSQCMTSSGPPNRASPPVGLKHSSSSSSSSSRATWIDRKRACAMGSPERTSG